MTLLGAAAACLLLACRPAPLPEGLILVPEGGPGSPARSSFHVRVGHGVVVRLPWAVESIAPDPEGLAATVARGRDVWLVGQDSGAATFDVRGARDAERATLEVSVDLRAPVEDARPGDGGPAAPGVIEVPGARGGRAARWTLARGQGSIVRTGFRLKRILVGDPRVLDFVVHPAGDVQLVPRAKGDTNLLLESDDEIELFAEVTVRDPEQLAPPRYESELGYLPSATSATTWGAAAIELRPGTVHRIRAPYVLGQVLVGDRCIADFALSRADELELEAHDVGRTRLFAWDERGVRTVLDVRVSGSAASPTRTTPVSAPRSDDPDCSARNLGARCRRDPDRSECKTRSASGRR